MKLNQQITKQVLDLAVKKGKQGFVEADILPLFPDRQYELLDHLDYLTDKGFIIGEFVPVAFATLGVSPQSIRFIRGEITPRGKEYLAGLKTLGEITAAEVKQATVVTL